MTRIPTMTTMHLRTMSVAIGLVTAATAARAQTGDFRWEKQLAAGSEVAIRNISGDIKVRPSTSGKVEVVGIKKGNSRYFDQVKAEVQETSRGVVICVLYEDADSHCDDNGFHTRSRGRRSWNDADMLLEVAVPSNVNVSASSVSGDVTINGAQGDLSVSTVSGDVKIDHAKVQRFDASSVSGDIELQIDAFIGRGDMSFHTVSGDITADLPKAFDADLTLSTVSGDLNSDYALTLDGRMSRRNVRARIGAELVKGLETVVPLFQMRGEVDFFQMHPLIHSDRAQMFENALMASFSPRTRSRGSSRMRRAM